MESSVTAQPQENAAPILKRVNCSLVEKDLEKLENLMFEFGFTTKNEVFRELVRIAWKLNQMQKQGYQIVAQPTDDGREILVPLHNME